MLRDEMATCRWGIWENLWKNRLRREEGLREEWEKKINSVLQEYPWYNLKYEQGCVLKENIERGTFMAQIKEEKKLAGYPSVDKPQNKYYRESPIREIEVNQTIYELIFNLNHNYMDDPALEYMGNTWTYEKLKRETDRAADAFVKAGLKLGDVVLIGVTNSPEAIVTLLALNKIGAVSKWIDVRAGENEIKEYVNDSDCKYFIAMDILISKLQNIFCDTKLQKVLIVSAIDSFPKMFKMIYKLKQKASGDLHNNQRFERFWDFVKKGDYKSEIPCALFSKERPSIMIQSSGTTGKPKIIVHSDFSATSCVKKMAYCDLPLGRRKSSLLLLPPWIAYALGQAIIFPLALGTKIVLCPTFEPGVITKYLGKFTISFSAPIQYRYLKNNWNNLTKKQAKGMKKVECFVSGGDKISFEENKEFEETFGVVLVNGYGNNEGWGALTINPINHNKYGTIGIPKYAETIISYDNETGKELKYGEVGEICVKADTMFLYYEGNETETNVVKRLHEDGEVWLHTGDLGMIDEDGFINLRGRLRRVIVRKCFKISAYTIEDKITEHPAVKECVAVEVKDKEEGHVPMAFIILKEEMAVNENSIEEELKQKCYRELKEYEVPKYFKFVDTLPYTQNGKYDFRQLEQTGNEMVKS